MEHRLDPVLYTKQISTGMSAIKLEDLPLDILRIVVKLMPFRDISRLLCCSKSLKWMVVEAKGWCYFPFDVMDPSTWQNSMMMYGNAVSCSCCWITKWIAGAHSQLICLFGRVEVTCGDTLSLIVSGIVSDLTRLMTFCSITQTFSWIGKRKMATEAGYRRRRQ